MAAVVVATQTASAELQSEVGEAHRLTLARAGARSEARQHEVTTFQVTVDAVHVLETAEVAIRSRLGVVCVIAQPQRRQQTSPTVLVGQCEYSSRCQTLVPLLCHFEYGALFRVTYSWPLCASVCKKVKV